MANATFTQAPLPEETQSQKAVTVAQAITDLDQFAGSATLSCAAGGAINPLADAVQYGVVRLTGAPASAATVTLPSPLTKWTLFLNECTGANRVVTVKLFGGSGFLVPPTGGLFLIGTGTAFTVVNRSFITPAVGEVGLQIDALSGQTADLLQALVNAAQVFAVTKDGALEIGSNALTIRQNPSSAFQIEFGSHTTVTAGQVFAAGGAAIGTIGTLCYSPAAGSNALVAKAAASQTASIQEWHDSSGVALGKVLASGRLVQKTPNSAPTDADLVNNSITWYLDEAGPSLKGRIRKSDGSYLTLTIANGVSPTLA